MSNESALSVKPIPIKAWRPGGKRKKVSVGILFTTCRYLSWKLKYDTYILIEIRRRQT